MNLQALRDELTNDPLARNYAAMTDAEAADDLNTLYRSENLSSLTGDQIFQATNPAEFDALPDGSANNTPDHQSQWLAFCGRATVNPFASANVSYVTKIFGSGSTTIANLQSLRTQPISRAQELGLPFVKTGHVKDARAIGG